MELSKKELELIIGCMAESISDNNTIEYLEELGFSQGDIDRLAIQNEKTFDSVDYSFKEVDKLRDRVIEKLFETFLE